VEAPSGRVGGAFFFLPIAFSSPQAKKISRKNTKIISVDNNISLSFGIQ